MAVRRLRINESNNKICRIIDLPTSERLELFDNLFNEYDKNEVDYDLAMYNFEEEQHIDVSNYTSDMFYDDWDMYNIFGVEDDTDDVLDIDDINTKEDACYWLNDKLAKYGNTYRFDEDDKILLNKLINKFGNTYFWYKE